jgi:hypothetical protein
MKFAATRVMPCSLVLRMVLCWLPQPNIHSILARRDCDIAYPGGACKPVGLFRIR